MADSSGAERNSRAAPPSPQTPVSRLDNAARRALYRGATDLPSSPTTPRTPTYTQYDASAFSSPGSSFRTDDETLVFHFDSRSMSAGLAGEPTPRCCILFSPERERRVGEYGSLRQCISAQRDSAAASFEQWGFNYELWRMDLRSTDLGHVYDKLERAVRDAITRHLLVHDGRPKGMVLILPSVMPQPLLSTLLTALFNLNPTPMHVTLVSEPTMSVIAAGLRAALVVDVGWQETVVTAVYEYREIAQYRSCRGMKMLSWETKELLEDRLGYTAQIRDNYVSFEDVEEVIARLAWCPPTSQEKLPSPPDNLRIIPLRTRSHKNSETALPLSDLAIPVVSTFFSSHGLSPEQNDDNEKPIPFLTYTALLKLPIDLREQLLHRVVVTGTGSTIPGLTGRLVCELHDTIKSRGWDPVHNYGSLKSSASVPNRRGKVRYPDYSPDPSGEALSRVELRTHMEQTPGLDNVLRSDPTSSLRAHLRPQLSDASVLSAMRNGTLFLLSDRNPAEPNAERSVSSHKGIKNSVRAVHSLGPWAGASLMSGLKISGLAQITREDFVKHGLHGGELDTKKAGGSKMWE